MDYKYYKKKNFQLFIITNQAGIGKGFFSLNKFYKFQQFMKSSLVKKNIFINDIEFCPFHPDATIKRYKKKNQFEKAGKSYD